MFLVIFLFIIQLYSQPSYDSAPSFTIPSILKVTHVENKVVKNTLWAHLYFRGLLNVEGWVPVAEYENKNN